MNAFISLAFSHSRTVLLLLAALLVGGIVAFIDIPKEAEPDVPIPFIYVSVVHEGVSPTDAERLLVRPLEKELQALEGLKEMTAVASEGHASVSLEFEAGFDNQKALMDVREKVDAAQSELPQESEEPTVTELNVALFPVISVILAGDIPEKRLNLIAQDLQDKLEALPQVLEAEIQGRREDLMEISIEPKVIETYGLQLQEVVSFVRNNNELVPAGAIEGQSGRLVVKVPGVVETYEDAMNLPLVVRDGRVVTFGDVAKIKQTFKEPASLIRLNGKRALALDVKKRLGANIIETTKNVREIVGESAVMLPANFSVTFLQDKSEDVRTMLKDLQNNVLTAIILVMLVIVAFLGLRPSLLVGLAIPGSFFTALLVIYLMGYSVNIVVLFSLILVVGLLVDGAIIVVELAKRNLDEGLSRTVAYKRAAARMSGPVIGAALTTLAVFFPLLFWPGIAGQFMKYLPITVMITLIASLFMALVFVPVVGGLLKNPKKDKAEEKTPATPKKDAFARLTESYIKLLEPAIKRPWRTVLLMVAVLVGSISAYVAFGRGVEFFPDVDSDNAQVTIRARGDLSIWEKDAIMAEVEERIQAVSDVKHVYGRTGVSSGGGGGKSQEDVIGSVLLELKDWRERRQTSAVLQDLRGALSGIAGIEAEVFKQRSGPGGGKPFLMEITSSSTQTSERLTKEIVQAMKEQGTFTDIEDTRPLPGIEWAFDINREAAARHGVDVLLLGQTIQMVTHGLLIDTYRPDFSNDSVDIRLRFPPESRHLDALKRVRVPTSGGVMPISNFVQIKPQQKVGHLYRTDAHSVMRIKADIAPGAFLTTEAGILGQTLTPIIEQAAKTDPRVNVSLKGEQADQKQAGQFLSRAFMVAIFLMMLILVTQFNSFYQAVLVLSAIVFSSAGVFLGLLITHEPFGIVMCGIALIALAGIVVNNNIVLIDTYNEQRKKLPPLPAAIQTGELRFRPVVLTAITTILGLMPMVLSINIDLIGREISHGAPSTQWWVQLATGIAGGLGFATVLTLFMTPALLLLGEKYLPRASK